MPWYTQYIDSSHWDLFFRKEAERKLGGVIFDWDNCMTEAKVRLWQKLEPIDAPSGDYPDAFVKAIYRNTLEDIRREECGRPRLPVRIKAEGPPITKIFEMFCLENFSVTEISHCLNLPRTLVSHWTGWIAKHKKCPKPRQIVSSYSTLGPDENVDREDFAIETADPDNLNSVEDGLVENEQLSIVQVLLLRVALGADCEPDASNVESNELERKMSSFSITDDESLVLRLRYIEQHSARQTALALKVSAGKLNKIEDAVLARLRDILD